MEKFEQYWCYNCGKPFTESIEKTVEHVPMKALFAERSDEYKKNILTVKGCFKCNNEYSKLDSVFRDFVSIVVDDNVLSAKMARSIKRSKKFNEIISFDKDGMNATFDLDVLNKIHCKHMKALFCVTYAIPFPKDLDIVIGSNYDDSKDPKHVYHIFKTNFLPILDENGKDWKVSGHEDIFSYRIATIRLNKYVEGFQLDVKELRKNDLIVCEIKYYKSIHTIMLAEIR